jgi:histidinol phosphatase-like PHP family hydrolase
MKYIIDNDLHIHSQLSSCSSDPEQTPARILQYAEENGLKTVCLTDHFWDDLVPGASEWYAPQDFAHISQAKPLPQTEKVRFLFGCETDLDMFLTLGVSGERMDEFDFIIIPTTHMHMPFVRDEDDDGMPETRAKLWVKRLDGFLQKDLPYHKIGIAHLACCLILHKMTREDYLHTLDLIPTAEMERLFARAAEVGVGIELNQDDMTFTDEEADRVLRMFRIAKEKGCKFYLGSDSHSREWFLNTKKTFQRAIDLLGLEESDKFII